MVSDSSFFTKELPRKLQREEIKEIMDFFRFLNVCGECGKWQPLILQHIGICMEDYLDPDKDYVKKTCSWCMGCEEFVYWKEYAWHSPNKNQEEIILATKKLLFQKGMQWAEELILPHYNYSEQIDWHIILAEVMKTVKDDFEKEIGEIISQSDEEEEE